MWSYFLSLIMCNSEFILTSIKRENKWDCWHKQKQGPEYPNIHSVEGVGLQFTLIKHISVSALPASPDLPSHGSPCLNTALFSLEILPSSSLLLCSPSTNASLSFPTTPDVSQSLKHLRVLIQVPFPCPIPLLRQLWMLPSLSMWNLSPGPFSFSFSSSKTAHCSLLPTSLIQMSRPCHTISLGLNWELKSIFQLIFGHSFCPYLSFHYSTLLPPPSLAFISPASLWPKTFFPSKLPREFQWEGESEYVCPFKSGGEKKR